jgi:hypothetical protein
LYALIHAVVISHRSVRNASLVQIVRPTSIGTEHKLFGLRSSHIRERTLEIDNSGICLMEQGRHAIKKPLDAMSLDNRTHTTVEQQVSSKHKFKGIARALSRLLVFTTIA